MGAAGGISPTASALATGLPLNPPALPSAASPGTVSSTRCSPPPALALRARAEALLLGPRCSQPVCLPCGPRLNCSLPAGHRGEAAQQPRPHRAAAPALHGPVILPLRGDAVGREGSVSETQGPQLPKKLRLGSVEPSRMEGRTVCTVGGWVGLSGEPQERARGYLCRWFQPRTPSTG